MRLSLGIHGGGDHVGEAHVGDEATAFFDLQYRFLALFPFGDADFAAQHAGFDPDERDGLGKGEGGADLAAVFAGFGRRSQGHVVSRCSGVPRSWMGRKTEIARQAAGGRARRPPRPVRRR